MGLSLKALTARLDIPRLLVLLITLLAAFLLVQRLLPRETEDASHEVSVPRRASASESLRTVWRNRHLRNIALMVAAATVASTLLDFQFKEAARARHASQVDLTAFFGAFYGWTGAAALLFQLLVATRLTTSAGIGAALAVLPAVLLLGSGIFALLPGLYLITLVRGADASLRRSLFRPLLEYLYVPLAAGLRRRTKSFVDSVIDPMAEGCGALLIFLVVTWLALPSRLLSLFIIVLAGLSLVLGRRMRQQYLSTLVSRLEEGGESGAPQIRDSRSLLSGTFTRLDLSGAFPALDGREAAQAPEPDMGGADRDASSMAALLRSRRDNEIREALRGTDRWDDACIDAAIDLLAQDALMPEAVQAIERIIDRTLPRLTQALLDEKGQLLFRRRIARILARCGSEAANDALLAALESPRFELRYRCALALVRREERGLFRRERAAQLRIWAALLAELRRGRPVWELQRLLDAEDASEENELVHERLGTRGELTLEHSFRLLSLVLDPEPVRAAFNGIVREDERLKSIALEYLEQVLPAEVRKRLWIHIGDVSEKTRRHAARPLGEVMRDLMSAQATLFGGEIDREALRRLIEERDSDRRP